MSESIRISPAILQGIAKHTQELIDSVAYKRTHIDKQKKEAGGFLNEHICFGNHNNIPSVEVLLLQGEGRIHDLVKALLDGYCLTVRYF